MTFETLANFLVALGNPPTTEPLTIVEIPENRTPEVLRLVHRKGAFLTLYCTAQLIVHRSPFSFPGRGFMRDFKERAAAAFPGHREFPKMAAIRLDPAHPRNVGTPVPRGWAPINENPAKDDLLLLRNPWVAGGWARVTCPNILYIHETDRKNILRKISP